MILLVLMLWAGAAPGADSTSSAQAHLGSGNQLMQAERFDEAAQEFRQALRDDPALNQARDGLATCAFELRDYATARPLLEKMLKDRKSAGLATYYLGRLDLIDNNLDSAIRRFRSLPRQNPVRDELYYLGSAYYKQESYGESVRVLKDAATANPRDARVHQLLARGLQKLGKSREAEQEFVETRRLHDYYAGGSVAIGRCRTLLIHKQPEAAWDLCRPMTETDDVDKLVAIGMLFGETGNYGQALTVWEKAVALDPDSSEVQYNFALTCFHVKDILQARKYAAEAVRLRPDFVEANILYGTILYMGAEDQQAIAVLTHANELKPEDPTVRRLLAEELTISAERHINNQQWSQAVDLLEKATKLLPDSQPISEKLTQVKAKLARNR
ncbi:MAG: tetratricopeptide repeat protein [Bryobacteraceae bacterium]